MLTYKRWSRTGAGGRGMQFRQCQWNVCPTACEDLLFPSAAFAGAPQATPPPPTCAPMPWQGHQRPTSPPTPPHPRPSALPLPKRQSLGYLGGPTQDNSNRPHRRTVAAASAGHFSEDKNLAFSMTKQRPPVPTECLPGRLAVACPDISSGPSGRL